MPAKQPKILIVEDDPDTVETLTLVLEGEGYQALHARNATGGLAKVHSERPDLILLDVMMPAGTEGFHFVWDLRNDPDETLRGTPVVIMTAIHQTIKDRLYPDQSDPEYGPNEYLPVQGFLDKPISFESLMAAIRRALGRD